MVEGARLESVYTGNRIAGSNPALSAISARMRWKIRNASRSASCRAHGANGTGLGAVEFVDALQFRSSGGTITFTMTAGGSAAYDFWVKGFWV